MGCKGAGLAAIVAAVTCVSQAQELRQQPPADAQPMKTQTIAKPMSQLLAEGYDIVTFSAGLGGYGYLLRKGRSWVICTVDLYGTAARLQPYSRCESLTP